MGTTGTKGGEGRDQQRRVTTLRLARSIKAMLATLDEPFDLDRIAATASLSRFHFVRQFRALTDHSPQRFHLKLRLQRAAWSLISTGTSITEIALAAGFESADGFARAFNRVYGVAPTAFRRLGADPWSRFSRHGYWRPNVSMPSTGGHTMSELRDMPALVYAAVRNVGPYNTVGPSFDRIVGWAAKNGLMTADTKVLGLAWDNPFDVAPETLRYDAAVTIDRRVEVPNDVHISALPAMTWFMSQHKGSYARMTESFMALGKEMGGHPEIVQVPICSVEIYLSGPGTPEADLLTEIGLPVVRLS